MTIITACHLCDKGLKLLQNVLVVVNVQEVEAEDTEETPEFFERSLMRDELAEFGPESDNRSILTAV